MNLLQNLEKVTREEQREFLESFDHVLSDMDGVLRGDGSALFPGVSTCKRYLTQLGKSFAVITSNTMTSPKDLKSYFMSMGFDDDFDVVTDIVAMSGYLKSINFNKQIYVIGSDAAKEHLVDTGFTVAADPEPFPETMWDDVIKSVGDDPKIGAVVCCIDLNINRLKIQKAINCLRRKDCLFIVGGLEECFHPLDERFDPIIANKPFVDLICEVAEREFLQIAKPTKIYAEYVQKRCNIRNSRRALFIGDSISMDMEFAATAGYQKLLVLSGKSTLADIMDWKYSEEAKPQYYVQDLNSLRNIISNVYGFEE